MRFTVIAVPLIFFVLAGCGVSPAQQAAIDAKRSAKNQERQSKLNLIRNSIPTCFSDKDCKAKWDAAQVWVIHNASFKMRTTTDVLIETHNLGGLYKPTREDYSLIAVRVIKEPMGAGKYAIKADVSCSTDSINSDFKYDYYACEKDIFDATLDFNRSVSAITP
ncbi:MAG: hypothetical protein HY799_00820 [Nitrosomonadales bacterium]|nr:hypothetical protein [Nitrosomonadales bacterium]